MYLEQRVEQLENVTVEQGKQIEMIASGLATLTNTVNNGFREMRAEFREIHKQLANHDRRLDRLEADVAELKADVAELKADMVVVKADIAQLKTDVAGINGRLDVMSEQFTRMTEGIEGLVTLLKSKLN